jgi:outer membrane biosynthesis protein TonB
MTKADEAGREPDPYELWRQLYETNERAWSAALEQAMGSPEFGESSGKLLETLLAAQKFSRDNMRIYLETMNVPTREDIARLGELVIGLEEKIDQLADRFDSMEGAMQVAAKPAAAAPAAPVAPAAKVAPAPKPFAKATPAAKATSAPATKAQPAATPKPAVAAKPARTARPKPAARTKRTK